MFLESLATNVSFVMQNQIHFSSINHSKEMKKFQVSIKLKRFPNTKHQKTQSLKKIKLFSEEISVPKNLLTRKTICFHSEISHESYRDTL